MMRLNRFALWCALFCLLLIVAACGRRGMRPEDMPTPAQIDALASAIPLTQNAPPAPFDRPQTRFEGVDAGLTELAGWRYVVTLEFNGAFSGTGLQTTASARAEVWFNQLATARRVLLTTSGELIGQAENTGYEAVRLGPDAFLLREGVCLTNAEADAQVAANLSAAGLVGGVKRALPGGRRATINGEDVYLYTFTSDDLNLPSVRVADGGRVSLSSGELWIAPARSAVVRYYANLDVDRTILLDRDLPVTGQLLIRYDLYDVGTATNISVPFGC